MRIRNSLMVLTLAAAMILSVFAAPANAVNLATEEESAEYVIDLETPLELGENVLTLQENAVHTIWEFTPAQPGVYRFTAVDENALVGYWGGHSPYVMDYTQQKSNWVECTVDVVGPSIMVGVSGVDSVTLIAERVVDTFVRQSFIEVYENEHRFIKYSLPIGAYLVDVDGSAVLGTDGFYHLNTVDGPYIVIDFTDVPLDLAEAASLGQMNVAHLGEDGHFYKTDYSEAMLEYVDRELYPVTEELAAMIQAVSDNKGWVTDGYISPKDENNAWLAFCKRVKGTDVKWQLNADATYDSETVDLRVISWVDSLDYHKVSFYVTIGGRTVELPCNTVYTAINAGNSVITDAGKVFGEGALYFVTYTIQNLPAAYYDTEVAVCVGWTDLNGVERISPERTFFVSDAM